MIPKGWEVGKIKDLIKSLDAGVSVNSENKSIQNGEIGVLKVSAVSYGKFLPSEHKVVLTEELHRLTIYPKKDRILISRANTPDLVGASVYIDRDYPNLFLPDKLWQTEPRHNNFSLRWLSYLISSDDYRLKISSHATGTSMSMKNISKVDLLNIEIIIPPLLEQCKIAEMLGVWDESIDLLERLIGRVRSRKQGLMQQLLTGKKRFKEFEDSEWRTVKLIEVAEVIVSPVDKLTVEGEISVLLCNYTHVYHNNRITNALNFMKATATEKEIAKFTLSKGDVIITKDSETPNDIAVPSYVSEDLGNVVCGYHLSILRPRKNEIDGEYLSYLLSTAEIRYYFFTLANGATRFGLSVGSIEKAQFNLPSLPEQEKIAAVLSAADEEISTLEKQLAAYKQQKLGLMQQLLTGKIRVG
jgi:type I restriction enzyme, S subunit